MEFGDLGQVRTKSPSTKEATRHHTDYSAPAVMGETIDNDADLEFPVTVMDNEITYEAAVTPFDNYGGIIGGETVITNLAPGHVIGFEVVALTQWSGDFGMLSENLMTVKSGNANQFAKYTLVEEAVCPGLLADMDGNCMLNLADFLLWVQEWLGGD